VWADKEKNTAIIQSPNISILGESNPHDFFGALELSHVTRGLVPRLLVIEPQGGRPEFNDANAVEPDPAMLQAVADLMTTCTMARHNNVTHAVPQDSDAARALIAFRGVCAARVDADDLLGDIWNRAHLNALRLATLIAVGVNHRDPIVTLEHAQWAIRVVEHCANGIYNRYRDGGMGSGQRDEPLDTAIKWWLRATPKQRIAYNATKATAETDVMPLAFFRNRLKRVAAYRDDRRGVDAAVEAQLSIYCKIGYLRKLSREESVEMGSSVSELYVVGPEFKG
jgi:hypothetical protein